jgi:hypothetical protein
MRRFLIASGLTAGLLALGACGTLGEPVTLTMAELTTRCEDRGGVLTPTGAATGRPQSDYICREAMASSSRLNNAARMDLNRAVDRSLRRGY